MPRELAKLFEIEENLARKELTPEQRAIHTVNLAALLKTPALVQLGIGENDLNDLDHSDHQKIGRGRPKGHTRKTAEHMGVTQQTVQNRTKTTAKLAGEKIDLENDSAEELQRKASKAEEKEREKAKKKVAQGEDICCHLLTRDPCRLVKFIEDRLGEGRMTLDDVIAYRDALVRLVQSKEKS